MEIEKKIGRYISIRMGIAMSAVMSLVGSTMGAIRGTNQAIAGITANGAPKPPTNAIFGIFMGNFGPSICISLVITMIIAIVIGLILPMKKINDGIENGTKTSGFVLHLLQSLVSDLIYTPFISLVMAFVSTALFVLPKIQAPVKPPFVPLALQSWVGSCLIEFVVALVVIMIVEPIFQKAAFKKYIPNYGQGVAGDENI